MTAIRLERVCARALRDVDLTVNNGELFVLLGPSGAGKSTLLQVIAGLLEYRGSIFFNKDCIDRMPPCTRRVGYLFQDLLLFPHMSVQNNLCLAMAHLKLSRMEKKRRAEKILHRFGILHLAEHFPADMSGGEKQRAALARAIATSPRILLLDEPFSSLDERTAEHLRGELKMHQRHLGITTIFVTHNRSEARQLADRTGIIRDGRLSAGAVSIACPTPIPTMAEKQGARTGFETTSIVNGLGKKGRPGAAPSGMDCLHGLVE